jgi:hypothetical protein
MSINIGSDGMGRWWYEGILPIIKRSLPGAIITTDNNKPFDIVIRSHFKGLEKAKYKCPYINISGEPFKIDKKNYEPIFTIDTVKRADFIWVPHIVFEINKTLRPKLIKKKKYCCAYAFKKNITIREDMFKNMRLLEPTCYSFGSSYPTNDNPFIANRNDRGKNAEFFSEFSYVVAMENSQLPGYITEKIGNAFCAGSVPIYWGAPDINELFNSEAFINVSDYSSIEKAAETVIEIWKDKQKLQRYMDAPITSNKILEDFEALYYDYRPWQKPIVDALKETFPDF